MADIDQRGGRVGCACQLGSCEDAHACDENLASPRQDRVGPFIFLVKLMLHTAPRSFSFPNYRQVSPRRFPDPANSLPDPVSISEFVHTMSIPAVR